MTTLQNPKHQLALNKDDVLSGARFIWWTPGEEGSQRTGTFLSSPYLDEHDELIVRYALDTDPHHHRTIDLCSMGITPNSSGDWGNTVTIYEEGD